jgi:CBS-domain-containing membrane protein
MLVKLHFFHLTSATQQTPYFLATMVINVQCEIIAGAVQRLADEATHCLWKIVYSENLVGNVQQNETL